MSGVIKVILVEHYQGNRTVDQTDLSGMMFYYVRCSCSVQHPYVDKTYSESVHELGQR